MKLEIEPQKIALHRLPWATVALVLACGVVLALAETNTRLEHTSFLAWGVVPTDFALRSALTHVFLHAHLPHLLGASVLLLLVAAPLEERWSGFLLVPLLALGALAAGSAYAWRTPTSSIPMVGLAGVNAALLGACLVRFRSGFPVKWYQFGPAGLEAMQLTLPVLVLLPLWFLGEVAGSIGQFGGVTRGVSYWGQLGGALAGVGFAALVHWTGLERRLFGVEQLGQRQGPHPAIQSALLARESGNLNEAVSILEDAVAAGSGDADLVVHFWEMASFAGKPQQAAPALERLIEKELSAGERQAAADHWCELLERLREINAPPRLLLQLTPLLVQLGRGDEAVRTLQLAACHPQLSPGMALRVVDLGGDLDPPSTLRAARIALTSADLHEAKRERLQALLRDLGARGVREVEPPRSSERSLELAEDDFRPPVAPVAARETPEEGFALSADGALVDGEIGADLAAGPPADPAAALEIGKPTPEARPPSGVAAPGEPMADRAPLAMPEPEEDAFQAVALDASPEPTPSQAPTPQTAPPDRPAAQALVRPQQPAEAPDPELDPDGLNLDEVPGTPGLALHGIDLDTGELDAVASLVDEMPSTGVQLAGPAAPGADPWANTGRLDYSSEDDDDDATGPLDGEAPTDALAALAVDAARDEPRFADAKIVDAIPIELAAERLGLQQPGGRRGHVEFARVDAIAVAAIQSLSEKPVVLLDLLANWTSLEGGVLRIIRLRSDQFDARSLVPDAPDSVEAFKMLAQILLEQCAAVALPDPLAAVGRPFRVCERLADYEREILQIDR